MSARFNLSPRIISFSSPFGVFIFILKESNELIRLLPTAAFVAIDEEMTGINIPNSPRPRKDDTPELRYDNLRAVPEKYSIIQLGICLFHQEPDYTPGASPEFIAVRCYS